MKKKIVYAEPADYFPKELRKKYKLGEYAEPQEDTMKAEEAEGVENCSESSDNQ
jgi:hypothetical protein